MPYIPQKDRSRAVDYPQKPGELNFAVTVRMLRLADPKVFYRETEFIADMQDITYDYLRLRAPVPNMVTYGLLNEVMGVFICACSEFARRVPDVQEDPVAMAVLQTVSQFADDFYKQNAAPYEDQKIAENGDVYPEFVEIDQG